MSISEHHTFDIRLAAQHGVEAAILIHHFQFWIRINRFKGKNIHAGRCWTYQTRKDIQAHFPYWTFEEVKYMTEKLVKTGILITGNYNKSQMDRTLWYGFVDEERFGVSEQDSKNLYDKGKLPNEWGKVPNAEGKTPSAIPDTKTYTITDTPPPSESGKRAQAPADATRPEKKPDDRKSYGKHVKLSEKEHQELHRNFTPPEIQEAIVSMNDYLDAHGKKGYKDYAAALRNWIRKEKSRKGGNSWTPQMNSQNWNKIGKSAKENHEKEKPLNGKKVDLGDDTAGRLWQKTVDSLTS